MTKRFTFKIHLLTRILFQLLDLVLLFVCLPGKDMIFPFRTLLMMSMYPTTSFILRQWSCRIPNAVGRTASKDSMRSPNLEISKYIHKIIKFTSLLNSPIHLSIENFILNYGSPAGGEKKTFICSAFLNNIKIHTSLFSIHTTAKKKMQNWSHFSTKNSYMYI